MTDTTPPSPRWQDIREAEAWLREKFPNSPPHEMHAASVAVASMLLYLRVQEERRRLGYAE